METKTAGRCRYAQSAKMNTQARGDSQQWKRRPIGDTDTHMLQERMGKREEMVSDGKRRPLDDADTHTLRERTRKGEMVSDGNDRLLDNADTHMLRERTRKTRGDG